MKSSDFRKIAREKLTGNWGKAAIISLVYFAFYFVLGFIEGILGLSDSSIGSLINIIIEIPIIYGLTIVFLRLFTSEESSAIDMFSLAFSNFKRSWGIQLQTLLKLLVPIIILVATIFLMIFGSGMALAGAAYSSFSPIDAVDSMSSSEIITGSGAVVAAVALILLIVASTWCTIKSYYYKIAIFIGIENPNMPSKEAVEKSKELMTGNRWKLFCLEFSFIGWAILASLTFGIGYLWLFPYMIFAQIAFYKHLSGSQFYSVENTDNSDTSSNSSDSANSTSDANGPIVNTDFNNDNSNGSL